MSLLTCGEISYKKFERLLKKRLEIRYNDEHHTPSTEDIEAARKMHTHVIHKYIREGLWLQEQFATVKQQMIEAGELPMLVGKEKLCRTYWITIRPKEKECTFATFYNTAMSMLDKPCFEHFVAAFEQKGTTEETLGQGFHVHILAKCKQTGKCELLRDIKTPFLPFTKESAIDIQVVKYKADADRCLGYIKDHKAKDGHKKITEEWDIIWRNRVGLQPLYTEVVFAPSIKSGDGANNDDEITVSFD